ncbi:hypothetical protein [Aliidiomarina sedimenti]|nr:hypothetical protein [Aliidiomarina sedimenti]
MKDDQLSYSLGIVLGLTGGLGVGYVLTTSFFDLLERLMQVL